MGRVVAGLHTALYRATGGRVGRSVGGVPVLLLTTTGRRSGRERTTPLGYVEDGRALAVVASNGGMDWFPAWWLNLQARPEATIEIGRRRMPVRAEKADPEERARLWPRFTGLYPGYAKYEERTSREIPVVLLHPLDRS